MIGVGWAAKWVNANIGTWALLVWIIGGLVVAFYIDKHNIQVKTEELKIREEAVRLAELALRSEQSQR